MSERARKWGILLAGGLLVGLVTVYFGGRCVAGWARMNGQKAYYVGDFVPAWDNYGRAMRFGGDRGMLEVDQIETLLFGLDQQVLGVKVKLPIPAGEAVTTLRELLARRLAHAPYKAYYWSLASDLYLYEARARRRESALDLSTLSDDPVKNLLPEEGLALAALEESTRREPSNYLYHDLLAEQYLEWGVLDRAVIHVRQGVALLPLLPGHTYLAGAPVRQEILDAAIMGFEDALSRETMASKEQIECDAGTLLANQGDYARAILYFRRALARAPDMPDALYHFGQASYQLGDYAGADQALTRAAVDLSDTSSLFYYLGLARLKEGKTQEGIEALRTARELEPHDVDLYHALAGVLESKGQMKDAERQFTAAAHLNPDQPRAWSALLDFYARHPDLRAGARRACAHLEGTKIDPQIYKHACDALLRGAP